MKLTKTKLKQIIKETMEEAAADGARLEELKESKRVLLDNMQAARNAEQYDIASSLEKSVMALEEAISALFYS